MNQNQIQQLTSHLSQALDQNYDVVNMDAVLSVICALEGTTITKEQLEATRLAKYINQLRRRTKNEHLARRAKSLLKKWREMVGIQQNVTESHQLSTVNVSLTPMQQLSSINASLPMQQQPSSDFLKTDPDMAIHMPLSPSQQIIHQDTQHSSDAVHSQMNHTSFPNFVNNAQKESKNILRRHEATPIMVEQTVANHENEAAVVIDIASDSDENDLNSLVVSSKRGSLQNPTIVSASLAIPIPIPSPSPKQKKIKKNKKPKDKDVQNIRGVNSKVADALSQADSEIFSLSNSSMSSIFSGDATTTLGTSQHNKQRLHASELTFSGRFKSVSGQNNNTAGFLTVRSTESSKKQSGKYDDYNIYDSSGASCSRLSPLNIEDGSRKMETKQVDARMQHLTAVLVGSNDMENTTSQSRSHLPKKRGRKRGSKGVDSLIAKESSTSLSQQIFFGQGSTVKKVKTTKELFNEIQSRKLSVSTTSNLSNSSTTNRAEQATMHAAILPRPTSSCSDTSIHSPQILETYSANVTLMGVDTFSNKLDTANTDSDTVTSEPSRDSNKSQDIKGTSLDNSNSNSFGIFAKSNMNKKKENLNDITTQLMHLIHSLKSPLSVYEIEEMYLAEMVPCSCLVVEEEDNNELKGEPAILVSDNNVRKDPKLNFNNDTMEHKKDKDIHLSIERLDNDNEIVENQAKPVRSIFDLDFDDDNDDINSITYEIIKPTVNMEERKNSLEARNVSNNVAQLDNNYSQTLETENNETIAPNLPMNPAFSVYEDPDCIAKQRFYVQTNKVTNFHINALHNYYIPNINGNWDDSVNTSSTLLNLKNNLIHPLESSYAVTNGADVVPKYGFITSDRIKKDLSSVKFVKPFKAKPFKSLIAPFLGVAKYLPTCRRAKRRLNIASNLLSTQLPEKIIDMGSNYNVPTEMPPLKVNIDVPDSSHIENPVPINILHTTSFDDKSCSVQDFRKSNNLLKLVNDDELQLGAEEIMIKKVQLVQNDWNGKNLNIKTTDNSSSSGSDSEDKTENANENDYENNEEYAIVQRPTSTSNDHIVLTIKKTPSKINSPANSMITTKASPIVTLNSKRNNVKKKVVPDNTVLDPLAKRQLMRLPFRPRHHHYRYHRTSRRKRNLSLTSQKVDLELKHIFNLKETVASDIALHEKLFFQHELCGENALGIKERIINYSSSSSNYDDESEIEVTSLDGEDGAVEVEAKNQPTSFDNTRSHNQYNLQIETDTTEDKFDSDDSLLLSSSDEDIDGDDAFNEPFSDEANNDMENNNLLKSFNSIYTNSLTNDYLNGSSNKYCNNNHLAFTNMTRNSIETSAETSTIKKLPLIGVEYCTGYRSSPEVNGTTTSIAGYQEFKEWHQVLQLKSYNNEPLIVLPYVVLE